MSTVPALGGIGREFDDFALDELLATEPTVFALGEPVHGVTAFPLLRNDILRHLVGRGYRSIMLEIDLFAAFRVDDYVNGAESDPDEVMETGFSHGWGAFPANRALVEWLRAHNAGRPPQDRVRFYGFDAPIEIPGVPSPRRALTSVIEYLPAALRPESARAVAELLGEDAQWTDPAAVFDPAVALGESARTHALRTIADDLASALRRAAPDLAAADPTGYFEAAAHARTALGLLRFHATMANRSEDRVDQLFSLRTEMMADNLLSIRARERGRGPSLVFAHNLHLRRRSGAEIGWGSAGSLVARHLGDHYLFVATDAEPDSDPNTLQGMLAAATTRRALFPTRELLAALPTSIGVDKPMARGHLPLNPTELDRADAVIFLADTDGKQQQYW
ncbi:erythromycin esterase family protein [Nocardia panacis]|uniref:Erythromycin esterase family protein n=1 Tax=Nocardia panacis TaxID=2340916 RepID=A0A3A4K0K1_9NOCA|nr:erythromycin esterase family protein [Nocardia panacis]RJO70803.1 erythromycin esterase family protein [Nocardia panacis]